MAAAAAPARESVRGEWTHAADRPGCVDSVDGSLRCRNAGCVPAGAWAGFAPGSVDGCAGLRPEPQPYIYAGDRDGRAALLGFVCVVGSLLCGVPAPGRQ